MPEPEPETLPFTLNRFEIAAICAQVYMRSFWWMFVALPMFGLVAIFAGEGLFRIIGLVTFAWPLTIPARAYLISGKMSASFRQPTTAKLTVKEIQYVQPGKGYRQAIGNIRRVFEFKGFIVIENRKLRLSMVPRRAFLNDGHRQEFLDRLSGLVDSAKKSHNAATT